MFAAIGSISSRVAVPLAKGKRQEADVIPAPAGMLDRRTLLAARATAGALA